MPIISPTLPADGDDAVVSPYNTAINAILAVLNGSIDASNLSVGAVVLSNLATAVQNSLVPAGLISPYGGVTAPTGWLLCDGSSVLRANYSTLFAILSTNYGSVDGTHFNLPDLRGRVPVGNDAMGGSAANRIQRTSTLTTTSGSPTATVGSATGLSVGMVVTNANVAAGTTISVISGTTLTLSANATGNGTTVAATFSMLGNAATLGQVGGTDVHTLVTAQLAAHTHLENFGSGATSGVTGIAQSANQSVAPGINSTYRTESAGGDQAHNNVQPSLITNYIIKT